MTPASDAAAIDLATRIQRRRDFVAHLTGFGAGSTVLALAQLCGASGPTTALVGGLSWATALSFQHFRHMLCGPVTTADVAAEDLRLAARSTLGGVNPDEGSTR